MTEAWVANASPLILLGRIGRLDLMEGLAPGIIVPDAVIAEITGTSGASVTWTTQLANTKASWYRYNGVAEGLENDTHDHPERRRNRHADMHQRHILAVFQVINVLN